MTRTQIQVKLMISEAQLVAAQAARNQASADKAAFRISGAEYGRVHAKMTRLQTKVAELRADLNGCAYVYDLKGAA